MLKILTIIKKELRIERFRFLSTVFKIQSISLFDSRLKFSMISWVLFMLKVLIELVLMDSHCQRKL